jgi:hypothetical protein
MFLKVRTDLVRLGPHMLYLVRLWQVISGYVRLCQVRSG